jgi:CO/xanthine dehydrogenase Mo-binding subunit
LAAGNSDGKSITQAERHRMATYQVIGRSAPPVDGAEKATGHARYAADITLPGTLWGKSLHSPYPHARIVRIDTTAAKQAPGVHIDTTAAKQVPGVHAVITGADVRGGLWGRMVKDVPVLAYDRVRFAGERVAAVAADDEDIAQEALDLIEVEYAELPAVFEPLAALQDGAPILHPDFNSYFGFPQKMDTPSNAYHKTFSKKATWSTDSPQPISSSRTPT